ncbi:MAG: hypothetical protein H0U74_15210 [Bradymonadaceae bacterium]|nr:hypothetical protein [Lujinxingiaceae bacterium]
MNQRTLWEWVELHTLRESANRTSTRGALVLNELPSDMRMAIAEAQALHRSLERELGVVDLVLTDNRRRMVSSRKRKNRYVVRIHHMFIGCDHATADALIGLARGQGEESRELIRAYIDEHRDEIRFEQDADNRQSDGAHHDLQSMLDVIRAELGLDGFEDIAITWGRDGRGRRSIRFGSYDFDQRLIRVHPVLDQDWVPDFFVAFIVYHEILHAVHPPNRNNSRRCVHTPEFREMEMRYAHYNEALAWEHLNIHKLLNRK